MSRSRELFKSLNASNAPPVEQFTITDADLGGFDQMTFTQCDFNSMNHDDRQAVCEHNVDLIIANFDERKKKSPTFYYVIHHEEDSINVFISFTCTNWLTYVII